MAVGLTVPWNLGDIVLVRHGQSKANTRELVPMEHGDHLIPLTEEGEKQAEAVGVELADFVRDRYYNTLIYCSPYMRTRQTLAHILKAVDAAPENKNNIYGVTKPERRMVYEDPRLREVDRGYGTVEGFVEQQALRERHGWFYYRFQGGESPADCYDRVTGFVDSMWRQAERKGARRVLIVSHGLTIRCLVMRFLHLSVEDYDRMDNPDNASIIRLVCSVREEDHAGATFRRGRWSAHGVKLRPPEEKDAKREHCFHHDGVGYGNNAGHFWDETCCHCGEKRSMSSSSRRVEGHGPHANARRSVEIVTTPPKSERCTPKPASQGDLVLST